MDAAVPNAPPRTAAAWARRMGASACGLLAAAGLALASSPPHLVWKNDGFILAHPWPHSAAAALAAAAALGLAILVRRAWGRLLGIAVGLVGLYLTADRVAYRVESAEDAISSRSVTGTAVVPWKGLVSFDVRSDGALLTASNGAKVELSTAGLAPMERLATGRHLARRVAEAAAKQTDR